MKKQEKNAPSSLSTDNFSMFVRSTFLHERNHNIGTPFSDQYTSSRVIEQLKVSKAKYLKNCGESLLKQTQSIPSALLNKNYIPEWYKFFNRALLHPPHTNTEEKHPLYTALSPFIEIFKCDLGNLISKYNFVDIQVTSSASFSLYKRLIEISGLTLYADYNEWCATLSRDLSKDAYTEWQKHLVQGGWNNLASKYPLLIRFIHNAHEQLLGCTEEILSRFSKDSLELQNIIPAPRNNLFIEDIEYGMSDPHNNGRSVCRITLSNYRTIIYKPKSLANEKWFFDEIVKNFEDIIPSLKRIEVIDKVRYGWAQDIKSFSSSNSKNEINYRDVCKIVILFYFLNSTDMHAENIVQLGGNVFPADLETILNANIRKTSNLGKDLKSDSWKTWNVLSTELLKYKISKKFYKNKGNGFSSQPAYAPFKKVYISFCKNNGITHIVYDPQNNEDVSSNKTSQDKDKNKKIRSIPNKETIRNDFNVILSRLNQLARTTSFKENYYLKRCKIRSIFRDTMFYERLFQRIYQPKMLTDGALPSLDLSDLYLRIKNTNNDEAELQAPIISEEISQILGGDIPLFWHYADKKDLHAGTNLVVKNLFEKTSIKEFFDKIEKVSEEDMSEQAYLIEASLSASNISSIKHKASNTKRGKLNRDKITRICNQLADKIVLRSIHPKDGHAKWVSYQANKSGEVVSPATLGDSFYSGYWGIIMFLHTVAKTSNCSKQVISFLEQENKFWHVNLNSFSTESLGIGLSDIGGILMGLSVIYDLDPTLSWPVKLVEHIYKELSIERIDTDNILDSMGGTAGFLNGTINIIESKIFPNLNSVTIKKIKLLGKHSIRNLISRAEKQEQGLAWAPIGGEKNPLLGFAHGNSGIITALNQGLRKSYEFSLTKEEVQDTVKVINEALLYIESKKHNTGSWVDLRSLLPANTPINKSWCHGASGLGLSFLSQNKISDNIEGCVEIEYLANLLTNGEEPIDFYCCGNSGALDFLIEVYRSTNNKKYRVMYEELANKIISNLYDEKFNSIIGYIKPELFPSLFQGVSGIGYTLLRIENFYLPSLSGYRVTRP